MVLIAAVSEEHRRRRRAAHTRSARAHEKAAEIHSAAALFFIARGDVEAAEVHHRRANEQAQAALADWDRAARQ